MMFATPASLRKRTGKHDVNRPTYLQQLANEFKCSKETEKQEQVLANLANFAYDPINYEYLRRFGIVDIFIDVLKQQQNEQRKEATKLVEFAVAGVCNLCLDVKNKEYLHSHAIVDLVCKILISNDSSSDLLLLNGLTILIFVCDSNQQKKLFNTSEIKSIIDKLSQSSNDRLATMAKLIQRDHST